MFLRDYVVFILIKCSNSLKIITSIYSLYLLTDKSTVPDVQYLSAGTVRTFIILTGTVFTNVAIKLSLLRLKYEFIELTNE